MRRVRALHVHARIACRVRALRVQARLADGKSRPLVVVLRLALQQRRARLQHVELLLLLLMSPFNEVMRLTWSLRFSLGLLSLSLLTLSGSGWSLIHHRFALSVAVNVPVNLHYLVQFQHLGTFLHLSRRRSVGLSALVGLAHILQLLSLSLVSFAFHVHASICSFTLYLFIFRTFSTFRITLRDFDARPSARSFSAHAHLTLTALELAFPHAHRLPFFTKGCP